MAKKAKKGAKTAPRKITSKAANAKSRLEPKKGKLLTLQDVAAKEKVAVNTVYVWVRGKKVKGAFQDKDSGVWFIPAKTYKRPTAA